MSSGSYAGKAGFNMSGKPTEIPRCPTAADDPPAPYLAGLCVTCGRATTRRDEAGMPRHAPWRAGPAACCPHCGGVLDGGPVAYWCPACTRAVPAGALSRERQADAAGQQAMAGAR